ncbi:MAG: translation initiation factor IF-2 [Porphyromonas sp.]|uniref:translation initiation factor IF-2 n=1 Tax=Porphyromonas sp. TaxID=1924944 RepID=UPI002A74F087|nr:translation initiation factor IF-2 [Porphyromonas sp.]MDD6927753.1 translation initiation factor IF-2 [Bacteroidales bacterium]MDY3112421.1 translation initiation factor IF-2 [Porphyromonas sp.]
MSIKLFSLAKELNIGVNTLVSFLNDKGKEVDNNPNTRITEDEFNLVLRDFTPTFDEETVERTKKKFLRSKSAPKAKAEEPAKTAKTEANSPEEQPTKAKASAAKKAQAEPDIPTTASASQLNVVGRIELDKHNNPVSASTGKTSAATQEEPAKTKSAAKTSKAKGTATSKQKEAKPEEPTKTKASTTAEQPKAATPAKETKETKKAPETKETKAETKSAESPKPSAKASSKEPESDTSKESTPVAPEPPAQTEAKPVAAKPEPAKEEPKQKAAEQPASTAPAPAAQEPAVKEPHTPASKAGAPTEAPTETKGEDATEIFRIAKKEDEPQLKVVGKIDLSSFSTSRSRKSSKNKESNRRKRKRISSGAVDVKSEGAKIQDDRSGKKGDRTAAPQRGERGGRNERRMGRKSKRQEPVLTPEEQDELRAKQVKETLARLNNKQSVFGRAAKSRREKREARRAEFEREQELSTQDEKVLKLTEFVTVSDLANMMNVPVTDVISTCMSIDMMVSINQRLDAETINIVAEEFGYETEFVSANVVEAITADEEPDKPEDLEPRPPVITIMGHVDHGKTSLLDCIRRSDVTAGEAGGITQHIGAYNVTLSDGRRLTVLDTPGHEAFTAMRARGAQITDIVVIVIAANDAVMPQTIEALNHASAAGVPIIFAINKIDVNGANPDKIREQLAGMNYLVEDWGGKYQVQEISAKKNIGIPDLLDKIFLEAELLELKSNPHRRASGSVIESSLDKGKGYLASVLIQRGTLHIGDYILAGSYYGRVKAMYNEYNKRVDTAGLSTAVSILGFNGAPTAGDDFNVMESEQDARELAVKREQLQREQGLRTQKMLTLDDIGRRIAVGNFQQFNLIIKGDVDGSVQALANSLIELSTKEIQVSVIHQGVGQITESDIQLATASDAVIIGFQVRPSAQARKLAEQEGVEIRTYSIIYDAIEDVRDALEGMLSPDIREQVTANLEVLQTFKVSKIGTIAGCMVTDGKIKRTDKVRVIRDGVVIHTGELESLKRFKDEAKEVVSGLECGINIKNYNNLEVGDIIESFEEIEVRRKL